MLLSVIMTDQQFCDYLSGNLVVVSQTDDIMGIFNSKLYYEYFKPMSTNKPLSRLKCVKKFTILIKETGIAFTVKDGDVFEPFDLIDIMHHHINGDIESAMKRYLER